MSLAETPQEFDPLDPAMAERRAAARKRLDAIDPAKQPGAEGDPRRRDWFEAVYALAEGDPANVPWGNMVAHPLLVDWLARNPRIDGLRALDIGCGLGDNAAALAGQGAQVTAFDLVPRAGGMGARPLSRQRHYFLRRRPVRSAGGMARRLRFRP